MFALTVNVVASLSFLFFDPLSPHVLLDRGCSSSPLIRSSTFIRVIGFQGAGFLCQERYVRKGDGVHHYRRYIYTDMACATYVPCSIGYSRPLTIPLSYQSR